MKTIKDILPTFHPDTQKYDFTAAVYKGALARIEHIICLEHGEFSQYSAQLRDEGGAYIRLR